MASEVMKLLFSLGMVRMHSNLPFATEVAKLVSSSVPMFLLAVIYAAMNILSFVALRRIDAAVFTVCAQLKILSTAIFSTLLLNRTLSSTKWRALILLALSCMLVVIPRKHHDHPHDKAMADPNGNENDSLTIYTHTWIQAIGIGAVILEVTLSGFASIYFERVVKGTAECTSVWGRNCQLALWSIVIYTLYGICEHFIRSTTVVDLDAMTWRRNTTMDDYPSAWRPFVGFSTVTWLIAVLGASGGLLVALSIKVADSILKSFATSAAIVLTMVLSNVFLALEVDMAMAIGGASAVIAILNYTLDATPVSPPQAVVDEHNAQRTEQV